MLISELSIVSPELPDIEMVLDSGGFVGYFLGAGTGGKHTGFGVRGPGFGNWKGNHPQDAGRKSGGN